MGLSRFFLLPELAGNVPSAPKPAASFSTLWSLPVASPLAAVQTSSQVDRSWSFQRVRSQSFLSWRLHLNTSLRASAGPTASAQTVRFPTVWHGTVLCDHPARPSSSQSHRRPSGITPGGSMRHLGLSKARRDRDRRHDRCNHLLSYLSSALGYQRVTHGISKPNCWHKSTAAAYTLK